MKNSMFGIGNVTTSLEFSKTTPLLDTAVLPLVTYNFNATSDYSDAVKVESHGKASVNIIFPYNTSIDVSVEAFACGQREAALTAIQFSECNRF